MLETPGMPSTVSNAALALPNPIQAGEGAAESLAKLSPSSSEPLDPAKDRPTSDESTPSPAEPADPSSEVPPPPSSSDTPASPAEETTPVSSSTPAPPPAPPQPTGDGSRAGQVVDLVNAERAKVGCAPLTIDSRLAIVAQGHSADMSRRNYFAHTTPEGVTFDQRIKAAGYARPGAENIAKGSTTAAQTMDMWMNSSGHRANILNCNLTKIGVGVVTSGWYWTQDFGY
ncbi:MAG: hypothetical protein QOI21_3493 [Actinomycetota bacterium]|nr:hypothetical protein [Actinomycetota bacterium]